MRRIFALLLTSLLCLMTRAQEPQDTIPTWEETLDEVVVKAESITHEDGKFVVRMSDRALTIGKDATEVLRLAPGVWVDDRGVSINGASGAKVYINNREVRLSGQALTNYLRNFRSEDIARVEVTPQAGAEYSADAQSGIIRIVLRRRLSAGLNGQAGVTVQQGRFGSHQQPSVNLNGQTGRWNLHALASADREGKGKSYMEAVRDYGQAGQAFKALNLQRERQGNGMAQAGMVYTPHERHSLGMEAEFSNTSDRTPSTGQSVLWLPEAQVSTTGDYRQHERNRHYLLTLNYIWQMDSLGSTLKLISDYTNKQVRGRNDYQATYLWEGMGSLDSLYRYRAASDYQIFTADLSLNKVLPSGWKYATGTKFTWNNLWDEVGYESHYQDRWQPLPHFSYDMDYTERIGAAYATASKDFRRLSLTLGLRGEYTHTTGQGREVRKSYFDLFPNVGLTYSFNQMRTMMLQGQYSRSIQRPNFNYLNPNRIQQDEYSYYVGNPTLRPTYIDRIGLTAIYHYRYIVSVGGNLHRDLVRERTFTDAMNPNVTYVAPENNHRENHWYVMVSAPVKFARWWNMTGYVLGVKQDITGEKGEATQPHYLYFLNADMTFTLPHKWYAELIYSGQSRLYSANAGIRSMHVLHANVKKTLLNDRLTLTAGVENLTDTPARYFATTEQFTTWMRGKEWSSSRRFRLSVQYQFSAGKLFKKRGVESSSESERERLNRVNQYDSN